MPCDGDRFYVRFGELSGLGSLPDGLELDLNPSGYGMVAGSEPRATERPSLVVLGRMAREVLETHLSGADRPFRRHAGQVGGEGVHS